MQWGKLFPGIRFLLNSTRVVVVIRLVGQPLHDALTIFVEFVLFLVIGFTKLAVDLLKSVFSCEDMHQVRLR